MGARQRFLATILLAFLLVPAVPAGGSAPAVPSASAALGVATAATVSDEVALTDLANGERARRGLGTLTINLQLVRVARAHAAAMAADDERGGECGDGRTLRHQGNLAGAVSDHWTTLRENVMCAGGGADHLHGLLMGSASHRDNLLAPGMDAVGVGAARAADGTLWVAQVFMDGGTAPPEEPVHEGIRAARATFAAQRPAFAVLSRSDLFADSLAGAALARGSSPVLFTDAPRPVEADPVLHPRTRVEVDRLLGGGGTVYLLGGPRALSARAEQELAAAGYRPVRLAGPTRIETAVAIAREVVRSSGAPQHIEVAAAHAWPDAVTGGAAAGRSGAPLVLTDRDRLPGAVASFLDGHRGVPRYVLGGPAAVGEGVVAALGATRVAGPTRAETALEVIAHLFGPVGGEVVVVHGYDTLGWARALAWSGYAVRQEAPEILVGDTVPDSVAAWLRQAQGVDRAIFASGVPDTVRAEIERLLRR